MVKSHLEANILNAYWVTLYRLSYDAFDSQIYFMMWYA